MLHIAIIGSGPAGCYLADQLLRVNPDASVDILEKLPVPFGLIRYGVAPDHQSTKAVARVFDRVLARDRVSFFGNVEVGREVRLDELMSLYDAVVLATGAPRDRRLGVAGEDLPGVVGSGAFVNWYNSHPCAHAPAMNNVRSAVIIGNGNVAIDVARILAKSPEEFAGSDVSGEFAEWLTAQPLETIHVVGRRGAAEAKFTDHELAELGTLQRARPVVSDPASLAGDTAVVNTLRGFAEGPARDTPITINFHFNLTPTAFVGDGKLREVQFRSAGGETVTLPAQLAVTCIGYETVACCTAQPANGVFANRDGKVEDRLYVVGWAKRGPSGTIPTNRVEAQQLAQKIAQEIADGNRSGGQGLRELLEQRRVCFVDYAGWRRIDAAELSRASAGRCREKFSSTEAMLSAALAGQLRPV
ncbi:MAG: FAD-dependent oxidoreductase [Candidatus Korobacteraceae bacterium]|jgi:NADPH-dependent glutamate synthase beta subunit-like oxidoreductase